MQLPQGMTVRSTRVSGRDDLGRIKDIFEKNGFPRAWAEVEWAYAATGDSLPFAAFAESGEVTAAMYATVPARFIVEGQLVLAVQSIDSMVDAGFRGAGLFTVLARQVFKDMADAGIPFVYGFPNGNSYPGFIRHLQWRTLDPVPYLFRPLSLGYAMGKISPYLRRFPLRLPVLGRRGLTQKVDDLPAQERVDRLWSEFSLGLNVARIRDHEFLDARYQRHPRATYHYRIMEEAGELLGLVIYCAEEKHGGKVGYLMEMMCRPGRADVARGLLADAMADLNSFGCDGVLAWCFNHSPNYREYLRQLFIPLPVSLRPIEMHFAFRPLQASAPSVLDDRAGWYLSYSDSDTV